MNDDAIERTGREPVNLRPRRVQPVRTVAAPSRVVERRDAILRMLDAAYRRDAGGRSLGL